MAHIINARGAVRVEYEVRITVDELPEDLDEYVEDLMEGDPLGILGSRDYPHVRVEDLTYDVEHGDIWVPAPPAIERVKAALAADNVDAALEEVLDDLGADALRAVVLGLCNDVRLDRLKALATEED